jgi:hypothetical protein
LTVATDVPRNPGYLDVFGLEKPDVPGVREFEDGTWMANTPEERRVMRNFMASGFPARVALFAAQHLPYAKHLSEWEEPLSPSQFGAAMDEARRKQIGLQDVLARLGYRRQPGAAAPFEDHLDRLNRQSEEEWHRYITMPIPGENDQDQPSPPEPARPASLTRRVASEASRLIREATGGKDAYSQTYAGRRERHLNRLVKEGKFPDYTTADRMTPRRKDSIP